VRLFIESYNYLHRRRTRAGADAFDFFERKNPIAVVSLWRLPAVFLRALQKFVSTLQHAGTLVQICTWCSPYGFRRSIE